MTTDPDAAWLSEQVRELSPGGMRTTTRLRETGFSSTCPAPNCRRRSTDGRRRTGDPLCWIRRLLRRGADHHSPWSGVQLLAGSTPAALLARELLNAPLTPALV
ncbi:hypothetical protein [Pseudonocardia sp. H11422]|uniref:hypothetical protein n=1 Tax=Pseudonocardia sp. H11422 TaxID=2835866 RepID=UPI001BDC4074|nr:hypothetical protein [Pseudonocardia sp. H11422]